MPVTLQRIAVFCGASCGNDPEFALAAQALARCMAAQGIGLVYGGGTVGLMGEVAREVLRASGNDDNAVLGFIPAALAPKELSGEMIGKLTIVDDMHTRKAQMAQHADGFIALPGGFGTLEELLEVVTWQQLGFHAKPVAVLNVNGFFDPLLAFFASCVDKGFIRATHNKLLVASDPAELIQMMADFSPPESLIESAKRSNVSALA
ncbi:hypothetical protein V8C86DRAFT_2537526 [Haematococcus lacustris]